MGSIICCCLHKQNIEPMLEIPRFYGEKCDGFNYKLNQSCTQRQNSIIQFGKS